MGYYKTLRIEEVKFFLSIDGLIIPHGQSFGYIDDPKEMWHMAYYFFETAYPAIEYLHSSGAIISHSSDLRSHKRFIAENYKSLLLLRDLIANWMSNGVDFAYPDDLDLLAQAGRNLDMERASYIPPTIHLPNEPVSGFVYLVKSPTGTYKIGRTKDIENRIATFNVKLPFEIELLHVIECKDYRCAEKILHLHFNAKRVNGSEFFALDDDDIDYIKSIKGM